MPLYWRSSFLMKSLFNENGTGIRFDTPPRMTARVDVNSNLLPGISGCVKGKTRIISKRA